MIWENYSNADNILPVLTRPPNAVTLRVIQDEISGFTGVEAIFLVEIIALLSLGRLDFMGVYHSLDTREQIRWYLSKYTDKTRHMKNAS